MAAALAAAGLHPAAGSSAMDGLDEDIEAALAAAGVGAGGGGDWGAALLQPATQASAVPPPPAAAAAARPPPPAHATGRAPLPPLAPCSAPSTSAPAQPVLFNAERLASMRGRQGPLLRAMIAEQARRGVRELYTLEHLRRLATYQAVGPLPDSHPKVYCKDVHAQPCAACATCHFCRQKTVDPKSWCPCGAGARPPRPAGRGRGRWCGQCLANRMGQALEEVLAAAAPGGAGWRCPCCLGLCNCSSPGCLRKLHGLRDTGQLESEARAYGFASVAHYLVITQLAGEGEGGVGADPPPLPAVAALDGPPLPGSAVVLADGDARALAAARGRAAARERAKRAVAAQQAAVRAVLGDLHALDVGGGGGSGGGGGGATTAAAAAASAATAAACPPLIAPAAPEDLGWHALDEDDDDEEGDDDDGGVAAAAGPGSPSAAAAPPPFPRPRPPRVPAAEPAAASAPRPDPPSGLPATASFAARAQAALGGFVVGGGGRGGAGEPPPAPAPRAPAPPPPTALRIDGALMDEGEDGMDDDGGAPWSAASGWGGGGGRGDSAAAPAPARRRVGAAAPALPTFASAGVRARPAGFVVGSGGGGGGGGPRPRSAGGGGGGEAGPPQQPAAPALPVARPSGVQAPAPPQPAAHPAPAAPAPPAPAAAAMPAAAAFAPPLPLPPPPVSAGEYGALLALARQALGAWGSSVAGDALGAAVAELRASLRAPVAVQDDGGGGGGAPRPACAHALTAQGALRDAAALLAAYAGAGPPSDAAYEVPARLSGREPFAEWGGSGVLARTALLGGALAAADALARRACDPGADERDAAALAAGAAGVARCVLGWVEALVDEAGAAADAAARLGPLGWAGAAPARVGPLTLAPGDPADAAAAALRGLQIGDVTLACHALDWAAARLGGRRGAGGPHPSAGGCPLAAALACPSLVRPLHPALPAHRAVRERARAATHALVAAARADLVRSGAGRPGATPATPLPPSVLRVAELVAAVAIPALEAGLVADYPLRRCGGGFGGGGGGGGNAATTALPGAALAAAASARAGPKAWPPLPSTPTPPAPDGLASTRATLLAESHGFLVLTGAEAPGTLLARAAAPYSPDRLWREAGAAAPYRALATHYAAVAARVAAGPLFGGAAGLAGLRPWLRFWLAALAEPGARAAVAGLTAALAEAPGAAWAFAGAGDVTPAHLLDEKSAHAARAAVAGAVLGAVRAREGPAAVSALAWDLAPVLALRAREAAAARRARRWRGGAVGLLAAAARGAAAADPYRRAGGGGGKSPLEAAVGLLAAWAGDAAADALDLAAARTARTAAGAGGGGPAAPAAAAAVPSASELEAAAYPSAVSATAAVLLAAGGTDGAPPASLDCLAVLADGMAGRGGGRGPGGAGGLAPRAAAALASAGAAALASASAGPAHSPLALAHHLISGPLRRALEACHVRGCAAADAGVAAARVTAALVCERGWAGGADAHAGLRTLLPPALAPFLDALCPAGAAPGGPALPAPAPAAAVFAGLRALLRAHGVVAGPAPAAPTDPPPPAPASTLSYVGGPLARGQPLPPDRFAGALTAFWRAAAGAAAGVVVFALGAEGGPSDDAAIPLLTPHRARAARGDLAALLGAPRPARPTEASLLADEGGGGGGGGGGGASTAAPSGGTRPPPDPTAAGEPPPPPPGDADSPAAQAAAWADAAVEALGVAADLATAGRRPAWGEALLLAVRAAVADAGGPAASQPGPHLARILAAYDDAATDVAAGLDPSGEDGRVWARLGRSGGGGRTPAPPPDSTATTISTPAALAAVPKGACLPGALDGVWAVGPVKRGATAAGRTGDVRYLNLHWGGPGGRKAAVVYWPAPPVGGGEGACASPLDADVAALGALPAPVRVSGLGVATTKGAVPILQAGRGARMVGLPRPALPAVGPPEPAAPRPRPRAPRLPVAGEGGGGEGGGEVAPRAPPLPPPPPPSQPSSQRVAREEEEEEEMPPPPRPPLAELAPADVAHAAAPRASTPPPALTELTPAAFARLTAPLIAAGHDRGAAVRALIVVRGRAAREDFLAGRPLRPPCADGEGVLVTRALAYLAGGGGRGGGGGGGGGQQVGGLPPPPPPPPHNA